MQIVIDIPNDKLKAIQDEVYCGISDKELYTAIKNARTLPKGHGRLIDEDDIRPIKAPIAPLTPEDSVHYEWVYMKSRVENAPTIIEADKEQT